MPPRSITLAILVFWVGMTAWLLQREIWPRIAPGSPPAFEVALLDGSRTAETRTPWRMVRRPITPATQNDNRGAITQVMTWVTAGPDDTLILHAAPEARRFPFEPGLRVFAPAVIASSYRVTREGRMLGFTVEVQLPAALPIALGAQKGTFEGEVRDRICTIRWESGSQSSRNRGSEQVAVSPNGVVLLPLHPLYRMGGLSPGRTWSVWLLDPVASTSPGASPQLTPVNASVLPDLQPLQSASGRVKECRVIEYEGKDISGQTWVDPEGPVLKVVFRLGNEEWEINRE
jgi:hypothetical protein